VMTHSDDDGLVIPPRLAPTQVVIVPIPKPTTEILEVAEQIENRLKALGISVRIDRDEQKRPGFKFAQYEMEGVPVRIGIGMRDLANQQVEVARRDTKEKMPVLLEGIDKYIQKLLEDIQLNLFDRAKKFRDDHITEVKNFDEFKSVLEEKGGFIKAHWDGSTETELKIKEETKATIRCIPNEEPESPGKCVYSGETSSRKVLFAKAY